MTPGPDTIRNYYHAHFGQVPGKKKRQDKDGKETGGLISGLA
jgi:hypothetical protein